HTPGREKLAPVCVPQLQLHEHTAQKVAESLLQPLNDMGKQMRNVDNILLFITTDDSQVLLLPCLTELKPVLQGNHTAADKVFKHLMASVITGRLIKQRNEGFLMVDKGGHVLLRKNREHMAPGRNRCSPSG